MKKVLGVAAFAVLGVAALSSCKKDYECTWTSGGASYSQDYPGLDKSAAEAAETNCNNVGGTWSTK